MASRDDSDYYKVMTATDDRPRPVMLIVSSLSQSYNNLTALYIRAEKSRLPMQPVRILLVEDNAGDVRLTREALTEAKVANTLTVARDGVDALAMLRREGAYAGEPRPDLILLDLNLPRMNGCEVLTVLKADPDLRRIPVVMLTTSDAERDVLAAYNLGVNAYVVKPVDLERFFRVIESLDGFWLSVVKLPS
jgi:chemotaxis family two-component system response regulator Rcp1